MAVWVVAAVVMAAPVRGEVTFDRWYVLQLQGQRAGWARLTETQNDDRITSDTAMHIEVKRGTFAMSIAIQTTFVETADGQPIEALVQQRMGGQGGMTQTMRFTPAGIEVTSVEGQSRRTQMHPSPAVAWLPPAASQRHIQAAFDQGRQEVTFHSIDPAVGPQPVATTVKLVGEDAIDVMGRVVPAKVLDLTVDIMPGAVIRQYADDAMTVLRQTVTLGPGLSLEMLAADEQLAKAKLDPPEMLVQSLVKPDRAIVQPRELRRAVYRLRLDGPADVPTTGVQRVEPADGGVTVTVDLDAPAAPLAADVPDATHLAASPALNHEDPAVRDATTRALSKVPADATDASKAEALRRFVATHVQAKDLSVGFATASEVVRTGQGDCTEHAVLLAAMLRAAGIPSRTVTGLIYVEQFVGQRDVFGYHLWTQAWLDGRWTDLDATLPDRPFDAAHIALGTSAMAEPSLVNDLVTMMPLLGRLRIEVVEPAAAPASR